MLDRAGALHKKIFVVIMLTTLMQFDILHSPEYKKNILKGIRPLYNCVFTYQKAHGVVLFSSTG